MARSDPIHRGQPIDAQLRLHECGRYERPRLLVSVRNASEAKAALQGGCDIIDVKEPQRGSLGMASVDTIASVIQSAQLLSPATPVSAALGEVTDWFDADSVPALPAGLDYVKLGLAGIGSDASWPERLRQVRRRFEARCGRVLRWVAVAYADCGQAQSPPPEEIVAISAGEQYSAILFDTHGKTGRHLLDWIPLDRLIVVADRIHESGLLLSLAGSVSARMLPELMAAGPDIVAIRTAACQDGQRTNAISVDAVRIFRQAMLEVPLGRRDLLLLKR